MGRRHGIEVECYNINRAEVIKGPASLLYGSDALTGVVSLFPFVPTEKDGRLHGRILSEYQHKQWPHWQRLRLYQSNERWLWIARGSSGWPGITPTHRWKSVQHGIPGKKSLIDGRSYLHPGQYSVERYLVRRSAGYPGW